jgi:hypothetical protein
MSQPIDGSRGKEVRLYPAGVESEKRTVAGPGEIMIS